MIAMHFMFSIHSVYFIVFDRPYTYFQSIRREPIIPF